MLKRLQRAPGSHPRQDSLPLRRQAAAQGLPLQGQVVRSARVLARPVRVRAALQPAEARANRALRATA
jgi:hypothetical protein